MIDMVELTKIWPNPWGPERPEDPQGIEELANSILAHGLLQEPVGRNRDGGTVELAWSGTRSR